jgi:FtsZ-interacting cell division protein YlmF
MASMWNKTLFYLGLVDEEQGTDGAGQPSDPNQPVQAQAPAPPRQASQQQVVATRPPDPYVPSASSVPSPDPYGAPPISAPPPGTPVAGRRVEPPAATARSMSPDRTHAEAGVFIHQQDASSSRTGDPVRRSEPESQVIVARNFSDAQTLADSIRMGRTVVLDLRNTEPEMVRRIVDFASGLTYALDGRMAKTAQGVILVTPAGSSLGVGEQDRLARIGLFGSPS